jgi:hypothetical protein
MQHEIGEFHESINDALVSAVTALGGYKKVGPLMRPELPIDQAAGWLRDCLNPGRREKLSPEQVLLVMRESRRGGYHALMNFIAFDTGYKASAVDPQTQEDELKERFCSAVEELTAMGAKLERFQRLRAA